MTLDPTQRTKAMKLHSMISATKAAPIATPNTTATTDARSSSPLIKQYSRVTVVVDELSEAQALHSSNEILKQFDIVSVTPGNQKVFAMCCQQADVDIITIDFRSKSLSLNKKLLDVAVQRGVCFELMYGPMIAASGGRQHIISNSKVLIQYIRGKHLILSSGCETLGGLRAPKDAMNVLVGVESSYICLHTTGNQLLLDL